MGLIHDAKCMIDSLVAYGEGIRGVLEEMESWIATKGNESSCANCGKHFAYGDSFCSGCGHKLNERVENLATR